jgi:DNA topoisomerase VI subunit B
MSGYGIKVQTDTGRYVWLTETGTHVQKTAKGVMKFESEAGAEMYLGGLMLANPHATLVVKKF